MLAARCEKLAAVMHQNARHPGSAEALQATVEFTFHHIGICGADGLHCDWRQLGDDIKISGRIEGPDNGFAIAIGGCCIEQAYPQCPRPVQNFSGRVLRERPVPVGDPVIQAELRRPETDAAQKRQGASHMRATRLLSSSRESGSSNSQTGSPISSATAIRSFVPSL